MSSNKLSLTTKIWLLLLKIGPGLFCVGYTIGTGSVTSMSKAGAQFGSKLLWVLALSCFFSWVLLEAYGRYAIVTGDTAIHSFKTKFKGGRIFAVLVIISVVLGQWCCLSGLIGLTSSAVYETFRIVIPSLAPGGYVPILITAVIILIGLYAILWVGTYSIFEKILVLFVAILALSFVISMFIVLPPPKEILSGFIPSVPNVEGAYLMMAAFVGTTMAAPTFVIRPLLMKEKGWTKDKLKEQWRDSLISALLMFVEPLAKPQEMESWQ